MFLFASYCRVVLLDNCRYFPLEIIKIQINFYSSKLSPSSSPSHSLLPLRQRQQKMQEDDISGKNRDVY